MNKKLICILLLLGSPAFAASKEEIAQTKKEMEAAKERKESLAKENNKLARELMDLQQQLVKAADIVQKGEAELSAAEEKMRALNNQLEAKRQELERRKKSLAALVQAALRLSRTPPEAVVMMPEGSEKTMKAARAMKMASASIKEEAEAITIQVGELEKLRQKVEEHHNELVERQKSFSKEKKELSEKLAARRALQQKLGREEQQEAEKIAKLAKQAEDLEGLVTNIEKAQKARAGRKESLEASGEAPQGKRGKLRSFAAAKGEIRPPLSGKIIQYFGAASAKNETSKGIVLLARPGAKVTAPYDGEVVFAGTFLNYGRMVILRHSDDFHTLLSGLAEINVSAGDFLLEGEPIGAMGEKESGARLYIELRKDNQPIDPAPWIK